MADTDELKRSAKHHPSLADLEEFGEQLDDRTIEDLKKDIQNQADLEVGTLVTSNHSSNLSAHGL